jgi:hypothetical protein
VHTRVVLIHGSVDSTDAAAPRRPPAPAWIGRSHLLGDAFDLALAAHGEQRRPADGALFMEHVSEVAELLHEAGCDDELVAVGLLHDSVERGTLTEAELRAKMGTGVSSLVMTLSEDSRISSFDWRKAGLRHQVENAGGLAVTVYAADKLSDIRGLRRGVERYGEGLDGRLGTSVASMVAHYRESVGMIESMRPGSAFIPALRRELAGLEAQVSSST